MRTKIVSVVTLCCLMSAPVQAASSFCPYHWWLAIVAFGEMAAANMPQHRREVRIIQGVAFVGTLGFLAKKIMDRSAADQAASEELSSAKRP